MTLRSEIHALVDQVGAAEPIDPRRVLAVAAGTRARQQYEPAPHRRAASNRFRFVLGRSAALAAALVVILLAGTLVLGGRLYRDWKQGNVHPATVDQRIIDELRARPLNLPIVQGADACPNATSSLVNDGGSLTWVGTGPVYLNGAVLNKTVERGASGDEFFVVNVIVDKQVTGPVLIRGMDLVTRAPAVFAGDYAAGKPSGSDVLASRQVKLYDGMAFDAGAKAPAHVGGTILDPEGTAGWGEWPIAIGFTGTFSNCFGVQVDGDGVSETIIGVGIR